MSDPANVADDTMKFGLLMESAQAHQKIAETHLDRLRAHTRDLDGVVRDEIRRTLVDELRGLSVESDRAAAALRELQRTARLRGLAWNLGAAVVSTLVPVLATHWLLPSASSIESLRAQRDALTSNIARLEERGGRAEWRRCGDVARLCVRIDREAPVYGAKSDYYVVKGY